jgi:hypothetical protein
VDEASEAAIAAAMAAMDRVSDEDPARVPRGEGTAGAALVYAERMSARLAVLVPDASPALRLAVRAQHLGRFRLPRSSHPEGRAGYLAWRAEQARRHAALARSIVAAAGLPTALGERVAAIVQKKQRATDPEAQALEDCACLVFLEHELERFVWPEGAPARSEDEVVQILQKTWRKMSPDGHRVALALELSPRCRALVERALG